MPQSIMAFDINLPTFTGRETPQQQIIMLTNYIFQMREGLQYTLQNLGVKNFNTKEWSELTEDQKKTLDTIQRSVTELGNQVRALAGSVTQLSAARREDREKLEALQTAVSGLEEQTAGLEAAVTEIWDTRTEDRELLDTLAGVLQVAADGSITFGTEGKQLKFIGDIYVNGQPLGGGTE